MLTTALDGDEDDQIHFFNPEENQFVAILGDIAEATPTEIVIRKMLLKVTQFNKTPVSNSTPFSSKIDFVK